MDIPITCISEETSAFTRTSDFTTPVLCSIEDNVFISSQGDSSLTLLYLTVRDKLQKLQKFEAMPEEAHVTTEVLDATACDSFTSASEKLQSARYSIKSYSTSPDINSTQGKDSFARCEYDSESTKSKKLYEISINGTYKREGSVPCDRDSLDGLSWQSRLSSMKKVLSLDNDDRLLSSVNILKNGGSSFLERLGSSVKLNGVVSSQSTNPLSFNNNVVYKVQYIAQIQMLFVLVGDRLRCHGYERQKRHCYPAAILMDQGVIDFDFSITVDGVVGACLSKEGTVTVFTFSNAEVFVVSQFEGGSSVHPVTGWTGNSARVTACCWVASYVLCCYDTNPGAQTGYFIYGTGTGELLSRLPTTPSPNQRLLATAIYDCLAPESVNPFKESMDDLPLISTHNPEDPFFDDTPFSLMDEAPITHQNKFAVLMFHPDLRLKYTIEVYQIIRVDVIKLLSFPLVATRPPLAIQPLGPWIMVSLPYGVEYYEWHKHGEFAQSTLNGKKVVATSWGRPANFVRKSAEELYCQQTRDLVVTEEILENGGVTRWKYICVTTRPLMEIVAEMMNFGAFNTIEPIDLMMYGHNVGCSNLVTHIPARRDSVLGNISQNIMFNEYGTFLSKFRHWRSDSALDPLGKVNPDMERVCCSCATRFSILLKPHRCPICVGAFCGKCATRVNLRDYGFRLVVSNSPFFHVCGDCIRYADQSLYLLARTKRYEQMFQYMLKYPETCSGFDFVTVLHLALDQCFKDKQYSVLATLIRDYISDDEGWEHWIIRFGTVQHIGTLAKVVNPNITSININTMILSQLMKTESTMLRILVRQWPITRYEAMAVAAGMEQILVKKRHQCELLQRSCETSRVSSRDRRTALGLILLDNSTEELLFAMLHIFSQLNDDARVVRAYITFFDQFHDSPEDLHSRRPRLDAVFDPSSSRVNCDVQVQDDLGMMEKHLPDNSQYSSDISDSLFSVNMVVDKQIMSADCIFSDSLRENFVHFAKNGRRNHTLSTDRELIDIIDFIKEKQLFPMILTPVKGEFTILMTMLRRHSQAVGAFLDSIGTEACSGLLEVILRHLTDHQPDQLYILDTLTQRNVALTAQYHDSLAFLYLDYRPDKLIWFLRHREVSNVDWKRLYFETRERQMFAEMVYVVGRMGDNKEAVRIAVRNLRDVPFAMQYITDAPSADQDHLWTMLIDHVIQDEKLIGDFLDHIAFYGNPVEFIKRIPDQNRLKIANESKKLSKVMRKQSVNETIARNSYEALKHDNFKDFIVLFKLKKRAVRYDPRRKLMSCGICEQTLAGKDLALAGCGHGFHSDCLNARYQLKHPPRQEVQRKAHSHKYCGDVNKFQSQKNKVSPQKRREARCRDETWKRQGERRYYNYLKCVTENVGDIILLLPQSVNFTIFSFLSKEERILCSRVSEKWTASISAVNQLLLIEYNNDCIKDDPSDLFIQYGHMVRKGLTDNVCKRGKTTVLFGNAVDVFEPPRGSNYTAPSCNVCFEV